MNDVRKTILSLILITVLLVMLTSCATIKYEENCNRTSMFTVIEYTDAWRIVYHNETKVMYAVSNQAYNIGTFTVLVNADGSPMLYEEK